MNHIKFVVGLIAVLLIGSAIGYWIAHRAMSTEAAADDSQHESGTATAGKRKALYWYDPMVPNRRFDKPGKSPFMDMQLVPMYADEAGESGGVSVSPSIVQNLGIRLGTVEKIVLTQKLDAVGNVVFDERLLELVQARVEGYVTRLYVKAPLERVRRGQPLAEILSPQWLEAQQEYLALLDTPSPRAQAIRDAARQRLRVLGLPESSIRMIETQRTTNATTTVFAPIDGVLTELGVRDGSAFMAGAALFRINGLTGVWVNARIPEAQVSKIPMGSSVTARATAWPGMTFKGRVIALLPDVDAQTRTLTARVALENREYKLAPGMFVALELAGPENEPQLVVPSEAVIMTGERSAVIVAREAGGFEVANVTVGGEVGDKTVILAGLQEGQPVVLSGQFLIDSEASLSSAVNRLEARGEAAGTSTHLTQGTIQAITPDQITIAHEPVPSLKWPAMTMGFRPPAAGTPENLEVGDRVSFSFYPAESGAFRIERIVPLDAEKPQ
ncbi:MAG: efflux RND transporter periplasmic adaptor subunit [Steroidobacteraceae bacterium]